MDQVLLDCSRLNHIDYRMVPALVERLVRFETRIGSLVVCGLSHYLRDLFRLAGCDARLRCWPSASDLLPLPSILEPGRECAS
jgi:anti-anti-sigma regulatory factor